MESVIVTVIDEAGRFAVDMDLPANLPLCELMEQIAQLLTQEFPALAIGQAILRESSGAILPSDLTLAESGVFDGATLIMAQHVEAGW